MLDDIANKLTVISRPLAPITERICTQTLTRMLSGHQSY